MKTAIVWFKTDLRLEIMKPFKSNLHGDNVLPVLFFDDSGLKTKKWLSKTGSFRAFLLESLTDLDRLA
jgi:deoxyribodipyrimidine photolyase